VQARLRTLAVLELTNVALLGVAAFVLLKMPATWPNVVGFALVAVHLIVGAGYWLAKLRQLRTGAARPPGIEAFRWCRVLCGVTVGIGTIAVIVAAVRDPGAGTIPGVLLALFAVAEYVNYFHVQLTHDTAADLRRLVRTRRLHQSHLAMDLRRHG